MRTDGLPVWLAAGLLLVAACGDDGASQQQPMAAGMDAPQPLAARVRATAQATLTGVGMQDVPPDGSNGSPEIAGLATFTTTDVGVDLSVQAAGVRGFASYPLRIADVGDCALLSAASVWSRGDAIPHMPPLAGAGVARFFYIQKRDDPKAWTVGGARETDVVGRAFVLYDARDPARPLACGVIQASETLVTPVEVVAQERAMPPNILASLAGICNASLIARETTDECPSPEGVAKCASAHCDVASCIAPCTDYAACLQQRGDACAVDCAPSFDCQSCMFRVTACGLDFCESELYCAAPPVPGGPCDKMRACCAMQGERAEYCTNTVNRYEKLSGVPSCVGLMTDLPFTTNIIHDPPCTF